MKIEGVDIANPNEYGGMCSRAVALAKEEKRDFEKGIDTVATTDSPTLIVDWERWQIVREVLPMRYAVLPDNDKVPLLDTHSRFSIEQIKGSAREWSTNDNQLLCKCFISESESATRQKISEGHIDSVSIGYKTDRKQTVEIPKSKSVIVDGVSYKNEFADEYPMLIRTWWKTKELSLVPIGADDAAKFKSVAGETEKKLMEKLQELEREINALKNKSSNRDKSFFQRKLQLINSKLKYI
jgi:hypothetical protein